MMALMTAEFNFGPYGMSELICTLCKGWICDVKSGETLQLLLLRARDHTCQ